MNINTAIRVLTAPSTLSFGQIRLTRFLTVELLRSLKWLVIILVSAVSILYMRDLHRRLFIQSQQLKTHKHQLMVERDKLLLEKGTWSNPVRLQIIAGHKFHMWLPRSKDIVLVPLTDKH